MSKLYRNLHCPLDMHVLNLVEKTLRCENNHCFDLAKEGYVNLLPVNEKRSKSPGDNKAMVQARSAFLAKRHYEKIRQLLQNTIIELSENQAVSLLDAGCGEGYYLAELTNKLAANSQLFGLDISKFAVAAAAKKYKDINWLVASNRKIPLLDKSLDLICCAFGFASYAEFAAKLKPTGKLILLETGEQHQIELRQLIYPELKPFTPFNLNAPQAAELKLIESKNLTEKILLAQAEIQNLLAMTPHLYRAPKTGLAKVSQLKTLSLTLDINLYVFEVNHSNDN